MMNQTSPSASQLASPSEIKPLVEQQRHEIYFPEASHSYTDGLRPNLPSRDLVNGPIEDYFKLGVPLYEACIRCNWRSAKAILEKHPELVKCSITENGETALHITASVKRSNKQTETFVKNLVGVMNKEDLALQNKSNNTALYLAAASGNIKTVTIMVEKNRDLLRIRGDRKQMMPLYVAALFGNYEVVKYLYENSNELCDDDWNPTSRGWLLEKCVEGDMFDVALKIVKKYPYLGSGRVLLNLARKPDAFSETKSYMIKRNINLVFTSIGLTWGAYKKESDALQILKIIWENIANTHTDEIDRILRGPADPENLTHALPLQKIISKHLGKLDVETENIMAGSSDVINVAKALKLLISEHLDNIDDEISKLVKQDHNKDQTSSELQKLISNHVMNFRFEFENMTEQVSGGEEYQATYLPELVIKHITEMRALSGLERKQYSSQILFIAAEMGNTKFLVELIRRYPDLIWKLNDDNQTIFHIAVKYRHEDIYNLLYEIGLMRDLITPLRDVDDNNMLHLAAKGTTEERLADVSGAALQMQRELLWYKEVRNMIPPSHRERKNKDGLTPRELFTKEHKILIKEGEKWMKETASQCMVVAALIATIVFAVAFTVPGGYNQEDGIPLFYKKPIFVVFVVADAMSLFLSSTSILTFLSILTSRYAERDFVGSLPTKLMIGILTLFLSIATMMVTFSVSFFVLYHREMKWVPILISVFALVPVFLYVVLQYHVLADVIRSTYGSKYLFKPERRVLYYVNPRV